ncbi:hypothetical protein OHA88_11970 [Streptomyces sp. NBC_00353]|uniref:hypothetical protein n=1 Tax=Streptomyces sp. NBC_00353 TaxID=2975722 RepID=UPI002E257394
MTPLWINSDNEVALAGPSGGHTVVLTGADGLENPTSVAVRGNTTYIASGAYFTNNDPNILVAQPSPGGRSRSQSVPEGVGR